MQSHLIGEEIEDAAFAYVRLSESENAYNFEFLDLDPVTEDEYESRSEYHLNVSEATWASAIKHAHDLQASLVEFHSHSGLGAVSFSESDFWGFKDFVPHIMWRLDDRPYLAIVMNETSYDGLVWMKDPQTPQQLSGIIVGNRILEPTNLSLRDYINYD